MFFWPEPLNIYQSLCRTARRVFNISDLLTQSLSDCVPEKQSSSQSQFKIPSVSISINVILWLKVSPNLSSISSECSDPELFCRVGLCWILSAVALSAKLYKCIFSFWDAISWNNAALLRDSTKETISNENILFLKKKVDNFKILKNAPYQSLIIVCLPTRR